MVVAALAVAWLAVMVDVGMSTPAAAEAAAEALAAPPLLPSCAADPCLVVISWAAHAVKVTSAVPAAEVAAVTARAAAEVVVAVVAAVVPLATGPFVACWA